MEQITITKDQLKTALEQLQPKFADDNMFMFKAMLNFMVKIVWDKLCEDVNKTTATIKFNG